MDESAEKPSYEWVHDLASRLMDGSLDPAEERKLGEVLQSSPQAREILRSYFRFEGAMTELARVQYLSRSDSTKVRIAPFRRRRTAGPARRDSARGRSRQAAWAGGVLAAAGLLGLLYFAALQDRPLPAPATAPVAKNLAAPVDPRPVVPQPPPPNTQASLPGPVPIEAPPRSPSPVSPLPPSKPEPGSRGPQIPIPEPSIPGNSEPKSAPAAADTVVTELTIERVEGRVILTGQGVSRAARRGDRLSTGQGLETGPDKALAVLTFPDGTRLEARPETLIRDVKLGSAPSSPSAEGRGGKSLFLARGSIWAHVRPQPAGRPFVMGTPRGEARVLGTLLTLRVDSDPKGSVRLDVEEGKVRFTRSQDGRSIDVPAGHSVSSSSGSELQLLRSTDVLASFQDGVTPSPEYSGTRDTYLSERNPQSNFGHAKSILAEGDDVHGKHRAQWPLLRWDLSSIPPGSRVRSASISLFVTEPSRGNAYYFFEPARPWTETETTWKLAASGAPWRLPGSLGGIDRWGAPLGTLAPLVKGEYTAILNDVGVALVQSWVNAPVSNLGFLIASPELAPGFHFNSHRAPVAQTHPKLTVVYAPRR